MAKESKRALRERIAKAIRKLPADVDVVVAADVVLEIFVDESASAFARKCKQLPAPVIREVLGRKATVATQVFLTLAVDPDDKDAALAKSWARALQGLADLEWINPMVLGRPSTKEMKEKFRALSKNKHLLPAIRGAAANAEDVEIDMLAVLVADGSDESFDALIPHLDPVGDHRLDTLRRLRKYAKNTPALRALFAELDHDADVAGGSPARAIARLVGLPDAAGFWFDASISSDHGPGNYIPAVQLHVKIDSRKAAWFAVHVATVDRGSIGGSTSFTHDKLHDDELGIGRCDAPNVPAWLASVAKKLRCEWAAPNISSNVRGAKREQIARWLVP